jgi:hypothetical protein
MKKVNEVYIDHDPYSRMIMNELNFLRNRNADLEVKLDTMRQIKNELEERNDRMKGVLYVTFMFSTLGILLVLENLLYPWLRTL